MKKRNEVVELRHQARITSIIAVGWFRSAFSTADLGTLTERGVGLSGGDSGHRNNNVVDDDGNNNNDSNKGKSERSSASAMDLKSTVITNEGSAEGLSRSILGTRISSAVAERRVSD